MISKIILSILLIIRYDAMIEDQPVTRYNSQIQYRDSHDHDIQQTVLNIAPDHNSTIASANEPVDSQLENIHKDATKFLELHQEFEYILKAWEPYSKDLRPEDFMLPAHVKGGILGYHKRTLDDMKIYINACQNATLLKVATLSRLQIFGETKKLIKGFTAIAMHINRKWEIEVQRKIISDMAKDMHDGKLTRQLIYIIEFGSNIIALNLMIENLTAIAYSLGFMAEMLQRLDRKSNVETAFLKPTEFQPDSDDKKHGEITDAALLQKMIQLKDCVATTIENTSKDKLQDLFNSRNAETFAKQHPLWMIEMEKYVNNIKDVINKLRIEVNQDPSSWRKHKNEMNYLLNHMEDAPSTIAEICNNADKNQMPEVLATQYLDDWCVTVGHDQLIGSLAEIFPWLRLEKPVVDEYGNLLYQYRGFTMDSLVRENEESKCIIVPATGEWYTAHSITVKCDWPDVESVLEHILTHAHDILVIQIHDDTDNRVMVLSGISGEGMISKLLNDTLGELVDHLPNNESMNRTSIGGVQIQYHIAGLFNVDIKSRLKLITQHVKAAKSPFIFDDMKENIGLVDLFETRKLFLRSRCLHMWPTASTLVPWKPGDQIRRPLKGREFATLLKDMLGKEIEIIKLETRVKTTSRSFSRSTFYQVKGTNILVCFQDRIEHPDLENIRNEAYLAIGIVMDINFITGQFNEKLAEIRKHKCNFYIMKDQTGYMTHLSLLISDCYVSVNNGTLFPEPIQKEMMKQLEKRYRQHPFYYAGPKFNEDDYAFDNKIQDVVGIVSSIPFDRAYLSMRRLVEQQILLENAPKCGCSIQ